ncbi:hypothetical protein GCM10011571_08160 [Marinithermofilum abyssi]|jgi:uncharacterized protein YfkK (UPF0435 family)|uniref:Uncharacterized protein n=1 Tax=Marinithermofilum abyssi TaxID=1571185 RepID=A0A8J2Y8U5_9BACL|nr:DUF1128 family protein [Marinithermofilum abyssi]GGE09181.1 hypothetical protein GCM10011571_08160 [Marinithermofilum abyssi]
MSLDNPSKENLKMMIGEMKNHLKIVNASIINPEDFRIEDYEEIRDLYELVKKKQGRLTMMEIEGVLEELGELRRK